MCAVRVVTSPHPYMVKLGCVISERLHAFFLRFKGSSRKEKQDWNSRLGRTGGEDAQGFVSGKIYLHFCRGEATVGYVFSYTIDTARLVFSADGSRASDDGMVRVSA